MGLHHDDAVEFVVAVWHIHCLQSCAVARLSTRNPQKTNSCSDFIVVQVPSAWKRHMYVIRTRRDCCLRTQHRSLRSILTFPAGAGAPVSGHFLRAGVGRTLFGHVECGGYRSKPCRPAACGTRHVPYIRIQREVSAHKRGAKQRNPTQ